MTSLFYEQKPNNNFMKKFFTITTMLLVALAQALFTSCTSTPNVPTSYQQENRFPKIFPDYIDVTIPCNIAPMNFCVNEGTETVVARFTTSAGEFTYGEGSKVIIDEEEWSKMLESSKGKDIKIEVFAEVNGSWKAYKPFTMHVAEEPIDEYISYRVIQPSYVAYEKLYIEERNITNFDTKDIYNNLSISTEQNGQCINCHSYQNYKTDRMLFHMRHFQGGTMIVDNGKIKKVDLKTDETISAGVYPAWHPTLNLVAFSTNSTGQSFHTKDKAKIEVQDTKSDLILYDVEKNSVVHIANDSTELEVFPTWSPDGKTLYYCSAHFEYQNDSIAKETEMIQRFRECKYSIYKMSFNEKTHTFGPRELVYDAAAEGYSATLPRISPDGRYLYFARGEFGCFHIWHPEADIFSLDLKTNKITNVKAINSHQAESYPVVSSNSRWLMCESRRDDGNYTRPTISYIDKNGKAYKGFEVPQKDPNFYSVFLRSFNRPEFMVESVQQSMQEFASVAKTEAQKATYKK